jgi:DNA-binding LacI/PurR family transcriptional regulator
MNSVYGTIAEKIIEQIKNGYFQPGDRVYSKSEICEKFEVSPQTATRVQAELINSGYVRNVRGSGLFANHLKGYSSARQIKDARLERVVFFVSSGSLYLEKFLNGVKKRASELNLDLRVEYINQGQVSQKVFSAYPARPGEGYIAVSTGESMYFALGALLLSSSVNTVLIDYIIPGSHCVLTDNFDGMRQLVEHVVSQGCKRLLFAPNIESALGPLNANEREIGFLTETKRLGVKGEILQSTGFNELIKRVTNAEAPDAILFPQDDPAWKCKKILAGLKLKNSPLVTGFDDFSLTGENLEGLTTLRVDSEAISAAAVNLLAAGHESAGRKQIIRRAGKLIVRS